MRNLIRTIVVLAMFGSRATIAQTVGSATSSAHSASATVPLLLTQNTRLIGAPVGHRQPHAPSQRDRSRSNREVVARQRRGMGETACGGIGKVTVVAHYY